MENLALALSAANQHARNKDSGQVDLFGDFAESENTDIELLAAEPWSDLERLAAERKPPVYICPVIRLSPTLKNWRRLPAVV